MTTQPLTSSTHDVPIQPRQSSATWREVSRRDEGRLLYPTGHGPRSLVVHYRATSNAVILHLPSYVEAANYLDNQRVAVEVCDYGCSRPVRFDGVAAVVPDAGVAQVDAAELEQWPPGITARYVVIRALLVRDDAEDS